MNAGRADQASSAHNARFLVCPPRYFDTHFLFNPWMTYRERVNKHRAWRQWRDLVRALEQAGACVATIDPAPESGAMVFTADCCLVLNKETAILLSNDGPRGDLEPSIFRPWFLRNGFRTESLPADARLDGGNIVRLHDGSIAVGLKPFASGRGEAYLAKRLRLGRSKVPLRPLGLIDKRFLHLDMVLGNVGNKAYLLYEQGLTLGKDALRGTPIREREVIQLEQSDAEAFAANLVTVGDVVITGKVSASLRKQISSLGFWVEELALTEFYKAGGGAKCLTLPLTSLEAERD